MGVRRRSGHGSAEQVVTDIGCKRISTSLPGSLQGIMPYYFCAQYFCSNRLWTLIQVLYLV